MRLNFSTMTESQLGSAVSPDHILNGERRVVCQAALATISSGLVSNEPVQD